MTTAAHGSTPLLETKLHVPRRRSAAVPRNRLQERLERVGESALTLVSAPAGFGKTTLLTEWLSQVDPDRQLTAWVALDERDNDPARFWAYVLAAVDRAAPRSATAALDLLPSGPIDVALATLLNDLGALPTDLVLVLDDYHVIDTPAIHDGMADLLGDLPPQVHLVIASRADPPLPVARLRARGELLEIRAADLRFTTAEAATYLNGSMGLALTPEDVGSLEARTEGWIAALQLAALSLEGRDDASGFIAGFAGDDRFIVDYLVGEVLDRQPDDDRDFLLQTSVLHRLTGDLCDAVTGQDGGGARLEALERANLFLVPLDDRRRWYRFHHLFADVLRAHLLDEQPDRLPELHRRAADWYEAHGDRPEAVRHALEGGNVERAAELIELAAPDLSRARQEATLRSWCDALPEDIFTDRPVLAVVAVGAQMSTGDAEGVGGRLQAVEHLLDRPRTEVVVVDEAEYGRLPAQIAMYRAALALFRGDLAEVAAQARRSVELRAPDDHLGLGAAAALAGLAQWTRGDLAAAADSYTESVAAMESAGRLADVLGCSLGLSDMQVAQGRLRDARRTLEHGLRVGTTAGGAPLRGTVDMHVALAELAVEQDDLAEARRHLDAARDLGEHVGLPQSPYRWRAAMARIRQSDGDLDAALDLLDEAEERFDTDYSPAFRPVTAMKARLHLTRGELDAAKQWARDRQLTAEDDLSYVQEYEHVTLARILLADGQEEAAARLLERLLAAAEAGGRTGTVIEVLVLLGRVDEARALAEPEGHARAFVDAAEQPTAPAAPQDLVDPLSERELDVLRLLRSELSGPEIANELYVSVNTLRTHTKRIFTKLGVNSRRAAVRRADELGL